MPALASALAASAGLLQLAAAAEPKVVGFGFTKNQVSDHANLAKRQKTVQAGLSNMRSLYQINVTVGTPPQTIGLQLDTGSADIWFPYAGSQECQENYCTTGSFDPDRSSTFVDVAQDAFEIQYVDNTQIYGDYIKDTISLGDTDITNMTMALATSTGGSTQGIMGIAFVSDETIAQTDERYEYPNFPVQLLNQGYISSLAYSLWLNDLSSSTGNILFGGVDSAKYHGDLIALPIQRDSSSNDITSFTVAMSSLNITGGTGKSVYSQPNIDLAAILDSGTTLTYLPNSIANDIIKGVGAINDPTFGYVVRCNIGATGSNITFGFGGADGPIITVGMDEMTVPLLDTAGESLKFRNGEDACMFGINPAGDDPILLGDTFLRSAYVVYDLHNEQVALANTNFNTSDSHVQEITNSTVPGVRATASGVAVTQTATGNVRPTASRVAGGTAAASADAGTPTFDLGTPTTTAKSGGSKKGAAAGLAPPRSALVGALVMVGLVCGGGLMVVV
ncbi:uncharacterized protein K452DRAFT_289232 [Aplosporella prunicola CBS 121167]|uniref:Probable aspartic-type endopeptidase OPSB n=1 Tax=Aplosporella prunicola CBS 121167 TaxID=1176127 RepID=A0A6A6B9D3_9PEZI|nr:uncharacterized protein K452DRAFT_289232 [Aplosporella prunicola CBS 121167]KAF2139854.1 hypothetical protein K452DRAFT_289232 [Aplosporella prunicola CBS 121167]